MRFLLIIALALSAIFLANFFGCNKNHKPSCENGKATYKVTEFVIEPMSLYEGHIQPFTDDIELTVTLLNDTEKRRIEYPVTPYYGSYRKLLYTPCGFDRATLEIKGLNGFYFLNIENEELVFSKTLNDTIPFNTLIQFNSIVGTKNIDRDSLFNALILDDGDIVEPENGINKISGI